MTTNVSYSVLCGHSGGAALCLWAGRIGSESGAFDPVADIGRARSANAVDISSRLFVNLWTRPQSNAIAAPAAAL